MSNPFKDQFLKKGLVSKKQAKRAAHEQRLNAAQKGPGKQPSENEAQKKAKLAREEQAKRDKARNLELQEAARAKEIKGQIREIIKQNSAELRGNIPYHFADGKKIQRIHISNELVDALSVGRMAIVKQDGEYSVLPAKAAVQIRDRSPETLILLNSPPKKLDPDDPYAEFPIPDDYEW